MKRLLLSGLVLLACSFSLVAKPLTPNAAKLEKKSKAGDLDATVELAHLSLLSQEGVEYDQEFIFDSFTKGAAAGNARAHYGLAKCYVLRVGTERNEKLALKHAQISADKGDPQGIRYLGNCYLYGRGMDEPDPEKGVALLKKSIAMGNPMAEYTYAFYLTRNREDRQSNQKGMKIARSLIERKHPDGMHLVGTLYHDGTGGLPRDRKLAMKHYRMAAALNHPGGLHQVGNMLLQDGKPQEAIGWLVKALNRGSLDSEWTLSKILKEDPELESEPGQWLYYAQRAADRGNRHAQEEIADQYFQQLPKGKRDWNKAAKYALLAAKQGKCHCWDWLGTMYIYGEHGLKKNYHLAVKHSENHFQHKHYSASNVGYVLLSQKRYNQKKSYRIKGYAAILAANKRGAKLKDNYVNGLKKDSKITPEEIKEAEALAETGFPKPGDVILE